MIMKFCGLQTEKQDSISGYHLPFTGGKSIPDMN